MAVNRHELVGRPQRESAAPPRPRDLACRQSRAVPDERTAMTLDLDALETSFDMIAPRGDELVDAFYTRLFEQAPGVLPLFATSDLSKQKTKLLATLVLLRKSLRNLEVVTPKLRQLGARHIEYGALPEHYPVVAEVLLASMRDLAGEAWTSRVAD